MPGLALLELARGDADGAVTTIRRALGGRRRSARAAECRGRRPASAGDIGRRAGAADELGVIASRTASQVLSAMAEQALGAVLVAEGDTSPAWPSSGRPSRWKRLRMPYEAARTAVAARGGWRRWGIAPRAARARQRPGNFTELGARPDLHRLDELASGRTAAADTGLSARELEVLALLAAGKTNREIAAALHLSPHTIGRHLGNIFAKLGVATRSAATAYAYEHGLLAARCGVVHPPHPSQAKWCVQVMPGTGRIAYGTATMPT